MFHSLKFTTKITLASSLVLIVILGVFTLNNMMSMQKHTEEQLSSMLVDVSQSASNNIAQWLNGKMRVVQAVVTSYQSQDDETLKHVQLANEAGNFKNTYVAKADGTFILDDPSIVLPDDYNATTRPWYQLASRTNAATFTAPYIDATTFDFTISAVVPIRRNGTLYGVAGADIDMRTINDIVNSIDFLGVGYGFLINDERKILAHPNKALNDKPLNELFKGQVQLRPEFQKVDLEGKPYLVSFVKIQGIDQVDWYLGVLVDETAAFAPVSSFKTMALVYLLLGTVVTVVMMQLTLRYLMKPMYRVMDAIANIARGEGDLTQRLTVENDDEFGTLSKYFNEFIDKIHSSIVQVRDTTLAIEHSVESLVDTTESTLNMYQEQTKRTDNVASAINQLSSSAVEIETNAKHASELASKANNESDASQTALNENIAAINHLSSKIKDAQTKVDSLNQHTSSIGQILEVIKGVSEQTNLLALNAAIEAARAGEAGRGFAVVADEVRQLAQRTQDSTKEIEDTIAQLQSGSSVAAQVMTQSEQDSHNSVNSAQQAGVKMVDVSSSITHIDEVNLAVASATGEQNQVIQTLDSDIHSINTMTSQGKENLTQTLSECQKLKQEFIELENMVLRFKV